MYNNFDRENIVDSPSVGIPATVSVGSDSYAYHVISVSKTGKTCVLQRAKQAGPDKIEPDPNGEKITASISKKDGVWRQSGQCRWRVTFGIGKFHMDPHF